MEDIPIYVINLDRSQGRLAHSRGELEKQGLAFVRVPAVDARDLTADAVAQVFDARRSRRSYYAPMHKGEIACYLSHRRAWETFLAESDAPFSVILEDDFELRGALAPALAAIREIGAVRWDMIKLWSRRRSIVGEVARLGADHRLVRHRVLPTLTVGQVVSREGARKLLRAMPIRRPIDVQMQYWWELDLSVLSVDPPLVADSSRKIGGSDLRPAAEDSLTSKLRRELGRPLFRLTLLAKSGYYHWKRGAELRAN